MALLLSPPAAAAHEISAGGRSFQSLGAPVARGADALSRGTAVVCPDFPLMRLQLSAPAAVGAMFDSLDELSAATARALALLPTLAEALAAHHRARDPVALACLLDSFVTRTLGRRAGRSPAG